MPAASSSTLQVVAPLAAEPEEQGEQSYFQVVSVNSSRSRPKTVPTDTVEDAGIGNKGLCILLQRLDVREAVGDGSHRRICIFRRLILCGQIGATWHHLDYYLII